MQATITPSTRPRSKSKGKEAGTLKARGGANASASGSGSGSGGVGTTGLVASASDKTIKGLASSSGANAGGSKPPGKMALRQVASESWDDDFLFQVSSTSSLALPLGSSSRPTTPSQHTSRTASSASPPQRLQNSSPPQLTTRKPWLLPSESVESLSSAGWSDPDPTITHSSHSTPRAKPSTPTPRRVPHSPSEDWRSATPSLSEADSSRDETEAESLEAQDDDGGIRRLSFGDDDERDRERIAAHEVPRPPSSSSRKSWKSVLGFGNSGRRTGAREVVVHPAGGSAQFVVLGRRSRANSADQSREHLPSPHSRSATTAGGILNRSATVREPKSSNDSTSTAASSTNLRTSLQFAPRPPPGPHSRSNPEPRGLQLAGASPGATVPLDHTNWREYDSTTSAEETGTEEEAESELSEDDTALARRRAHVTPSTSFAITSGSAAWDASSSQTSFASSASAFGLAPGRTEWDAPGADSATSKRRKLKKKRPSGSGAKRDPEKVDAMRSLSPSLNQPLLSSKASGSSNGTSINTPAASINTFRRVGPPELAPSPPPFALDSGDEGARRRSRQRSATSPVDERGQVVEVDRDWLGVVPFPPDAPTPPPSRLPLATRLTRKPSAPGKSHPPVTGRNQSGAKRPMSLSNLLSKSTSAIPLGGRRAPSPVPLSPPPAQPSIPPSRTPRAASSRPPLSQSSITPNAPSTPSPSPSARSSHRHTSSASDLSKLPKVDSSPSLLARARAFSRTGSSKPAPPPTPPSPPRTAPPPPARLFAARRTSREQMPPPPVVQRGQLNSGWKMPARPDSLASDFSSASAASTLRPLSDVSTIGPLPSSLGRNSSVASRKGKDKARPPPTRAQQQGHRPSLSLSSVFDRPKSPHPPPVRAPSPNPHPWRPRTAMAVDRPASYYFEDGMTTPELARRNSLSDLRIPTRITSSQARIEEDLESVKQFAKGIDDLKSLRQQYNQLVRIVVSPPSSPDEHDFTGPSASAVNKIAQAIKRIEIDYQSWWEQAEALVDLGDGKTRKHESPSPGVAASRRDRCVSLAQTSPSKRPTSTGSDTETEDLSASPSKRPEYARRPSASSVETGLTVEERQREMLWGVLAPASKGASLPSRGPPSPRPTLPLLDPSRPTPTKFPSAPSPSTSNKPFTGLSQQRPPPRTTGIRRVSKAGVSGIKDFLLRLKLKASEELAVPGDPDNPGRRSVSSPSRVPPATPARSSSEEDEDWDRQSTPEISPNPLSMRRARTQSTTVAGAGGERMALTTEAMPSLLLKVKEVHERCFECVTRLKGLTV